MASMVNTTTLDILLSADTPKLTAPWVVVSRANAETWSAIAQKYRKWVTDHVEEMTALEKATVDGALLDSQREATTAQFDNVEGALRASLLTILDELNAHALKMNAILDAIDNGATLAQVKANIAAVSDYPQRTVQQMRNAINGKLGT